MSRHTRSRDVVLLAASQSATSMLNFWESGIAFAESLLLASAAPESLYQTIIFSLPDDPSQPWEINVLTEGSSTAIDWNMACKYCIFGSQETCRMPQLRGSHMIWKLGVTADMNSGDEKVVVGDEVT